MPIIKTASELGAFVPPTFEQKEKLGFINYITKKQGTEGFWEVVDAIMMRFYRHPLDEVRQAMKDLELEAKFARENAHNDFGASKSLSVRRLGIIPDRLYIALNRIYDREFPVSDKKFQQGFFKRYPQFLCCNRI